MKMKIATNRCRGCGSCANICPSQAITVRRGKAWIDGRYCMQCGTCMVACPNDAITMIRSKREKTVGSQPVLDLPAEESIQ